MPISIYPPTLKSTQPAFLSSTSVYPIYFNLQSVTAFSDIGHVQIRVVRQSNNRSIVNTKQYPDGIIYKSLSTIDTSQSPLYSVSINRSADLIESWQAGCLYKVQMRFGTSSDLSWLSDPVGFATWKQQQIDQGAFSEWSTVMVIKTIAEPQIYIMNSESVKQDVITTEKTEATLTPLFVGYCKISSLSKESVNKYRFTLYEGDTVDEARMLETSDWLQHNSNIDSTDNHRFKTVLVNNETYTVTYEIDTINGYWGEATPYTFIAIKTYLSPLENVSIRVDSGDIYCSENGCINIYCTSAEPLTGNYIITRSDEKSNFAVWEDLSYLAYAKQEMNDTLIYQDFTIESGIKYKYAFQMENAAGLRTAPVEDSNTHYVNFEYSYLYRDGVQLKFKFNQTLSSFKHTALRTKQDTLGDRYPHLVQNGQAYYAEFPISGMISFHMDDGQTFFTQGVDGYYYKGELVIPKDKFMEDGESRVECGTDRQNGTAANLLTIDTNLTADNVFVERIFREKAEEFLNDFEYKLYKSPTEGNIIVGLINISLTPNAQLGRMIFNFSATAYEVLENTIENLDEINIINIGEFSTLSTDDVTLSFGQIDGLYGNSIDIKALIKEQEEISIAGGYKMNLKNITSIWVEQYPQKDFTAELLELYAERAEALSQGESTREIDAQIAKYEGLQNVLSGPLATVAKLNINGADVLVAPNKIYQLKESVSSLTLVSSIAPIIVNYVCELTQKQDETVGVVSAIDTSRIWGQISGIFTGTSSVLKTYDYDYQNSPTTRIFNPLGGTVIEDSQGNIVVDNTNYNVYKSVNIYDIIKEETQRQVELIYETKFELVDGELTDGSIYYEFGDLILFDIEAEAGTHLKIGRNADGSDAVDVYIGKQDYVTVRHLGGNTSDTFKTIISESNRYVLSPLDNQVRYIALEDPQFCIINYKCLTNQMKMTKQGG